MSTTEKKNKVRGGILTNEEKKFIRDNIDRFSPEDIALKLNRHVKTVRMWISMNISAVAPRPENVYKAEIKDELRHSKAWQQLYQEFTPDELEFFEEQYVNLVSQFKSDVLATEDHQIMQAIKLSILMHRNLSARKKGIETVIHLEELQDNLLSGVKSPKELKGDDKEILLKIQNQIEKSKSAEQQRTSEYDDLQHRHDALIKALKGTREQRISQIEAKQSFLATIKSLQDEDRREQEGESMAIAKMAMEKEIKRLGKLTKYPDDTYDRPLLNSETVEME